MADTEQEPVYAIVWGPRIEHNGVGFPKEARNAEGVLLYLRDGRSQKTTMADDWRWDHLNRETDIIAYQIGRRVDVTALMARAEAAEAIAAELAEALKPRLKAKARDKLEDTCRAWEVLSGMPEGTALRVLSEWHDKRQAALAKWEAYNAK